MNKNTIFLVALIFTSACQNTTWEESVKSSMMIDKFLKFYLFKVNYEFDGYVIEVSDWQPRLTNNNIVFVDKLSNDTMSILTNATYTANTTDRRYRIEVGDNIIKKENQSEITVCQQDMKWVFYNFIDFKVDSVVNTKRDYIIYSFGEILGQGKIDSRGRKQDRWLIHDRQLHMDWKLNYDKGQLHGISELVSTDSDIQLLFWFDHDVLIKYEMYVNGKVYWVFNHYLPTTLMISSGASL